MDNQPAFPTSDTLYGGMSLLDYFAAKAMQAAIINGILGAGAIADRSYNQAEAMMVERKRRSEVSNG